jgi:hypothetical protein
MKLTITPTQVLLDLLLASRHLPSSTSDPEACRKLSLDALPLTSVVLDTLLCHSRRLIDRPPPPLKM